MIGSNGWEFKEKDGAGLFFEKDGERLVATTEMWGKITYLLTFKASSKIFRILLS